ncbi:MFS transporter [Spirochaetia bacterium 38H-sp]|uniref:MFS transporter n=1 Tax=Rarispira pelagica TaxID=3141764 RepID=A0ABU9UB06_9SPIR
MSRTNIQEKSWILYDWANSAHTMIIMTVIFPIFFKKVLAQDMDEHSSTAIIGYANSIVAAVIAILSPVLGTLADYKDSKKRFFTVFFMMGVLSSAGLAFIAVGNWMAGIILFALSILGFSGANIFYDSMLIDITSNDKMDRVSTSAYAWGYIGGNIPFIISYVLISQFPKFLPSVTTDAMTRVSFLIAAGWWAVFTIPFFIFVKQKYFVEHKGNPIKEAFVRIYHTFKNAREYKALFIFLIAYFFYIDGVVTIIKMAIPIGLDIGLTDNTLLLILLVVQFVAFPFSLIYGWFAKKFGTRPVLFFGLGTYFVIVFIAIFLPYLPGVGLKTAFFWGLAMLVGTAQGGIQSLSRSYYAKLVPKEKSAEFFGFYNVMGKFAAIMGPALVGGLGDLTKNTSVGISSLLILFIVGLISLIKVSYMEKEQNNA